MSSEPSTLFSLARSKLQTSVSNNSLQLRRWVLLKNSIVKSQPPTPTTSRSNCVNTPQISSTEDEFEDEEEDEEADSFLFPDAGKLAENSDDAVSASEAEWLDSLLENLADEDDVELIPSPDVHISSLPADEDDEDINLSPLNSPMASSDDLLQSSYYPPPIAVPYPVPYPPYHPPLINSYDSHSSSQEDHRYYDFEDDIDPVPDAIEDTSDDESDALSTPSLRYSPSSSSLVDPASIPLPMERRRRPHVYVDSEDTYFYPFELDPLPFPEDDLHTLHTFTSPLYQEC